MSPFFPKILAWFEADYQRPYQMKRYWGMIVLALLTLVCVAFLLRVPVQQVFDASGTVTITQEQKHTQIQFPVAGRLARDIQPGLNVNFKDNTGSLIVVPIHHTHFDSARQTLLAHISCSQCQLALGQSVTLHIVTAKQSVLDLFVHTFNPTQIAEDE